MVQEHTCHTVNSIALESCSEGDMVGSKTEEKEFTTKEKGETQWLENE